jgi:hypothetical protein
MKRREKYRSAIDTYKIADFFINDQRRLELTIDYSSFNLLHPPIHPRVS